MLTTTWLAACGRLGFDEDNAGLKNPLPDAGLITDAPSATQDAAPDAVPAIGPKIMVAALPSMSTECGNTPGTYDVMLMNPGDQDLVITGHVLGTTTIDAVGVSVAATAPVTAGTGTYQVTIPAGFTVPAGGSATFQVQPPAPTIGTDLPNTSKRQTLTLMTNITGADAMFAFDLVSQITGANIVVTIVGGGGADGHTLNMDGSSGMCPDARVINVQNTGTQATQVNAQASGVGGLGVQVASGFTSGSVSSGGGTTSTTYKAFTTSACSGTAGTLKYTTNGASGVCSQDVTINVVLDITGSASCSC